MTTATSVPWGQESSLYNLNSDHYDLHYVVTYALWGADPATTPELYGGPLTDAEARERSRLDPAIGGVSRDNTFSINVNALNGDEHELAWNASETFAVLVGLTVVETDAGFDPSGSPDDDFATIVFSHLPDDHPASGRASIGRTSISVLNKNGTGYIEDSAYMNGDIEINPNKDINQKKTSYIHELAHAFDINGTEKSGLDPQIDNEMIISVSYNDVVGASFVHFDELYFHDSLMYLPQTPMIADILAIDFLWGLADEIMHGDTTYGVNSNTGMHWDTLLAEMAEPGNHTAMTIMDTGGYDTLNFSDHDPELHGLPLRINMNPYWSSDVYSTQMNFIIGPDTWIERAIGGIGDDHITGNIIDNDLIGNAGNDTLLGGPGNDTLHGGPGADVLDGHTGNDTAIYSDSPSRVDVRLSGTVIDHGDAAGDTLIDIENLTGSAYNDTLAGNAQDNILIGNAGNDLLWGSGGNDTLQGGPGNDRLVGNAGLDTIAYLDSPAGVTINLAASTLTGGHANGDTLPRSTEITTTREDGTTWTETFVDVENITGSGHNDNLTGDARANTLNGAAGNDILAGLAGADVLTGGPGSDTADYSASDTGVKVRLHSLTATYGHAQGDTFGKLLPVPYTQGDGSQATDLLPDIENLTGSGHNDVLAGDRRNNILNGQAGDDTLYGGPGGGDDTILGGPGNDRIYGGAGNDRLTGGPGNDVLVPGAGQDVLIFAPGDGEDVVRKFNPLEDSIDLTGFNLDENTNLVVTAQGSDYLLDLRPYDGGTVTFTEIQQDGEFVFVA